MLPAGCRAGFAKQNRRTAIVSDIALKYLLIRQPIGSVLSLAYTRVAVRLGLSGISEG